MKTRFTDMIRVEYPIIMAPMFLVSNTAMVTAALKSGITAAFPALNYRTDAELRASILAVRELSKEPFGVNLIVNKSNVKYRQQLETCLELGVDYLITSLGSPRECIDRAHQQGMRVFCDVVDLKYAQIVRDLGADGVIAVSNAAGGHAGNIPPQELIGQLRKEIDIPIISAGGIHDSAGIRHHLEWGADAVSVGTVFIASTEAGVSDAYKQALVQYKAKDVVRTTRMSGSALTVINTPYMQKMRKDATWLERVLLKNKWLKKYVKLFIALRGLKTINDSANKPTYKTVWVAGPVIEHIHAVRPVSDIAADLTKGL